LRRRLAKSSFGDDSGGPLPPRPPYSHFLEIKFLALAQAAEAFHRRFSEGKDHYMDQSAYERDVLGPMEKTIPAGVNESHRQSLRGRLRFGNE
jgi:hypothetical protein